MHASAAPRRTIKPHLLELLSVLRPTPKNTAVFSHWIARIWSTDRSLIRRDLEEYEVALASTSDRTDEERRFLAEQFLKVLRPLCDRFGIFRRKEALENRAFELVDPAAYRALQAEAKEFALYDRSIQAAQRRLQSLLGKEGMPSRVQGRLKSLYSIHLKRTQRMEHRLYDLYACRIILRSKDEQDCYRALSLLHHRFMAVPERFKDYVAIPKLNGYQSIHTVLTDVVMGIPIEIQIRTDAMHAVAEEGIAAHWRYVAKKERDLFRESAPVTDDHPGIFVLTPKHDIMQIPIGTTARGFAGIIHSRLPRTMKAARINDTLVSPDTLLQDGDRIDIVTSTPA